MAFDLTAVIRLRDQMSGPLRRVQGALSQVTQSTNTYRDANGRLRDEHGRFARGASRFNGSLKSMTLGFGSLAASVGVAGVAFSSVNKAMNFEAQMSTIKALTNASDAQMAQMQKLALETGAATKYSALEAAQGIEELLKAGLSPAAVKAGGLKSALDLATAGGLDLAEASEIMSTALNAFKDDGMKAADAANILAGTANASATDVHDLRYSLSMVAAVASGLGLSFRDTNQALGVFANNGLKGSDAGTSLKTMLSNLQPKSDAAIGTMMDLGIMTEKGANAFFDAHGKVKSMAEIAGVLSKALKDLNPQQRQQALYTMFGSDAIRAANILFKEGSKGIKEFNTEMSKVTALDVAREKMNNASGAVEQFKGALETLQISVLLPLMPVIKDGANALAQWVANLKPEQINSWGQSIKDAGQKALEFGKFIYDNWGPIKETIIGITVAVATFKAGMAALMIIQTINTLIAAYRAGTLLATVAQWGLNTALLANPIGIVIALIAGLVAAGVLLYRNWDTVKVKMASIWNGIKSAAAVAVNFMIGKINALIELINKIPGVDIPLVPKVNWGGAKAPKTYGTQGGQSGKLRAPSHASGLSRVPYNGYMARLHKDERVLTPEENKAYNGGKGGNSYAFHVTLNGSGSTEKDADKLFEYFVKKVEAAGGAGA